MVVLRSWRRRGNLERKVRTRGRGRRIGSMEWSWIGKGISKVKTTVVADVTEMTEVRGMIEVRDVVEEVEVIGGGGRTHGAGVRHVEGRGVKTEEGMIEIVAIVNEIDTVVTNDAGGRERSTYTMIPE